MVGSANVDLVARVPYLPKAGETLTGRDFVTGFGGKGANQAVMASRLGARVSAVVKLGRDAFGEETLQNLRNEGIDTAHVRVDEGLPSGVASIFVDDAGENVIVIVPGANGSLSPEDVREASPAIHASSVLMCQLETPLESTLEAFRIAKQAETLTVLNPAPATDLPDELLQHTDVLVPNEVEATMLGGDPVETPLQALGAAQELLARGPELVIITLGARGAVLAQRGGPSQHFPAEPVTAVDTTGAGDAFVGSLAYFLGSATPPPEAVKRALLVATRSVQRAGAQASFPYRHELAF